MYSTYSVHTGGGVDYTERGMCMIVSGGQIRFHFYSISYVHSNGSMTVIRPMPINYVYQTKDPLNGGYFQEVVICACCIL